MPPTRRSTRPAAAAASYSRTDRASSDSDSPAPAKKRNVRSTRNPRTVIEPDSDDDLVAAPEESEDEDEIRLETTVQEDDEEDDEDEDVEMGDDDDDEDAEGEEDEIDEPAAALPPPKIQLHAGKGRQTVTVKPAVQSKLKSVEDKEMEDDDELSDLESDGEGIDTLMNDEDDEELDGEDDEDDDEDADGSREGTPDLSKLTKRQRGGEDEDSGLMALSNEAQIRKHISAEEHAMRRAEMARRRKNLSEKRNEEEKIDTINKLLKKPAPKRRTRAEILAAQAAGEAGTPDADGEYDEPKPDPIYVRWVSDSDGSRIGVPDEWLAAPVGTVFTQDGRAAVPGARILVEEVA